MATTTTTSSPIGPTVTPSPTSSLAPTPRRDDYDWLITPFTLVNESGTNSFMLTSADEPEPVPITLVGYAEFRVINPNVQIDIRIMGVTVWDANDEEQNLTGNFNIITENSIKDFSKVSVPINIVPKDVASYNTIKDKKLRLQINFAYNYNMQSIVGTPVNYYFYPNDILANYNVYINDANGDSQSVPNMVTYRYEYDYDDDDNNKIIGRIDYIPSNTTNIDNDNENENENSDNTTNSNTYEFIKTEISILGYDNEIETELNRFVDIEYTEHRSESNSDQITSCDYKIHLKQEYKYLFSHFSMTRIIYTTYFKINGDVNENIYSNVLKQAFYYHIENVGPQYNTEPSQLLYKIYENFDNIIFSPDSLSFYVYEANNTEIDLNKLSIDVTYKNDHIADKFNIKYDKISNTSTDDFPVDTSQKIYNRVKVTLTPLYNVYDFNGTYQITAVVLTSSGGSTGLQFRTRSNTVSAQIYGTITYEFNISKEYDGSDVIMDNFATIYALYSLSPKFQFDSYAINLHVYNDKSSPIRVDSYISSLNDIIYDTPNNTSEPPTGEPTTEDPITDEPPTGEPTTETSTNDDITVSHVLSYITTYDTNGFITQVKINTDVLTKFVNNMNPDILLNCNFDISFQLFVKHIEDQTIVSVPSTNTLRYVYTNASMTLSGKSSHNISSGKPYILSYNYILPSIYRLKPPIKIEIVHNNQSISKSYTYNLDEINNYASIIFATDVTPGYYDIYLQITYTDTNQRDITVSSDPKSVFLSKDLKDKPLARDAAYIYCYVPDGSGYKSSYPSSVNVFEEFINRYGVNIDQTYFEIYTNTNTPIFQYSYKTVGILKQLMLTFTNEGCTKIVSENPNDPTTCYVVYCISVTRNSHMFSTIYLNNFFKDVLHTDVFESTSQKVINTNGISMIEYENVDDNNIKKIDYYLVIPNGVLKQLPPITDNNGIFILEDYINCTYYIKNSVLYVDIRYSNKYEDTYKNISYTALENQI